MVIPVGKVIKLNLVTGDVNHSFWLPKLAGKTDLIAGQENTMWLKADEPGEYWGQCAEFCGDSHAYMLFRAYALSEDDYNKWVKQQHKEPAAEVQNLSPEATRGKKLFTKNCASCHRTSPTARGNQAPNLAHIASRKTLASGWIDNTPENLHRWIQHSEEIKPGNLMYLGIGREGDANHMAGMDKIQHVLTDANVDAIVTYLQTLK